MIEKILPEIHFHVVYLYLLNLANALVKLINLQQFLILSGNYIEIF